MTRVLRPEVWCISAAMKSPQREGSGRRRDTFHPDRDAERVMMVIPPICELRPSLPAGVAGKM